MEHDPSTNARIRILESQIAALNDLLEVQEQVVGEQAGKLEKAMRTLDEQIRRLKLAENRLQRYADDLKRANEEVKQFAYIVSHDLRAPLVNLKGFTAELRVSLAVLDEIITPAATGQNGERAQETARALNKDIPEALGFIEAATTRMDDFVNALLHLSRLGHRNMVFEPLNLDEIVRDVLTGLAHQMEERHVKVTVGPLPEITGDQISLKQILGNLLTNAVNYLEPDRPGEIEVTGEQGETETFFSIRDNGRGIAKSDMPKLFMPFRRLGIQNVKGEGMGLAYVQTLAHRHGGRILCESSPGVGTTFTVILSNRPNEEAHHDTDAE